LVRSVRTSCAAKKLAKHKTKIKTKNNLQ